MKLAITQAKVVANLTKKKSPRQEDAQDFTK